MFTVFIDDQEVELLTIRTICRDRSLVPEEQIITMPSTEALISFARANAITGEDIECVFLDIQLREPDGDRSGYHAVSELRGVLGNVAIVAFTRHCEDQEFTEISARDFDGLMLKQDFMGPRTDRTRFRRLIDAWRSKRGLASPGGGESRTMTWPVILHMADVQFGRQVVRANQLAEAMADIALELGVNVVVLSGDVAHSGHPTEYAEALVFLNRFVEVMGWDWRDKRRFVIVPGNHDVSRSLARGCYVDARLERREHPHRDVLWEYRFAPFFEFLEEFYGDEWPRRGRRHRPSAWTVDLRGLKLVLVAINTSDQEDEVVIGGQITESQYTAIERELHALGNTEDSTIVAVMHYPLQVGAGAGPGADGSRVLGEAPRATRRLWDLGCQMVLTGHLHFSSIEEIPLSTAVAPGSGLVNLLAGSGSVPETDRPTVGPGGRLRNEIAVIAQESVETWKVHSFEMDVQSEAFIPRAKFPGRLPYREIEMLGRAPRRR